MCKGRSSRPFISALVRSVGVLPVSLFLISLYLFVHGFCFWSGVLSVGAVSQITHKLLEKNLIVKTPSDKKTMRFEIAEFYEVDIREIIDGERKSENMNDEVKETMLAVADYADKHKKSGIKGYYYVCPRNALLRIHNLLFIA